MANDPTKIRLGPCRVRWGGRDLGLTKGGVEIELKTDTKMVQVDQFGNTPVDEYIIGRTLTVKVPFAESDIDAVYSMLRAAAVNIVDTGVKATGTITFAAQPTANDTITVNGHVFTYVTAPTVLGPGGAAANQIAIGSTTAITASNTATILSGSSDPLVQAATYSAATNVVTVTYISSGTVGNSFTLAKSGTNPTVSGATLSTGTAATRKRVEIPTGIGVSLQTNAMELILHPQARADNDYTEDFVVPFANTNGSFQFAYKLNEERVMNLTYTAYPDPSTAILCTYGNKW